MIKETRGVVVNKGEEVAFKALELKNELADDEVLVNIHSAPIHPADVYFSQGMPFPKALPTFVGFEGSGLVIAAGKGDKAQALQGKRVGILPFSDAPALGSWGEHSIMRERYVYPLPDNVTYEDGASSLVNPFTAQGLINMCRLAGHTSFVAGAASSAVGRMLVALSQRYGMKIICLVRKAGYVDELKQLGADHVVVTSAEDYHTQLDLAFAAAKPTAYLDPVAGSEGSFVVSKLPPASLAVIYGTLDQSAYTLSPGDILFGQKIITGFMLNRKVHDEKEGPAMIADAFENLKAGILKTKVIKRFNLDQFKEAIDFWKANSAGEGKILLVNNNFKENN